MPTSILGMSAWRAPVELVDAWSGRGIASYPVHQHEVAELVLHRAGRGVVQVDGGSLPFSPGSVVYCPPLSAHGEHQEDGLSTEVVLQFRWSDTVPPGLELPWVSPPGSDRWLEGEFVWLSSDASRRNSSRLREAHLRLAALIAHLLAGPVCEATPQERAAGRVVIDAQAWIAANAARASVAGVARALGTSPDYLNRLFKAQRGYGPRVAIALARIHRAKRLLRETRLPLQAVAEGVGYATARHFCAVFRRLVGTTPGVFRRRGQI